MAITTISAGAALKNYYLSAVSDQLKTSVNPFLARIRQTNADVYGKDVRKLVRVGVNGGVGAGTEDGLLPSAKGTDYALFVSTLKNLYGTIEITDKAIRASRENEGAFVNLLNDEMEQIVKSAAFNFSRMLFGDGTGLLGVIESGVSNVYKVTGIGNFAVGMCVDVYNASNISYKTGAHITKVDYENSKVTIDMTADSPANYKIYLHNSKNLELTGLGAIFGKGAIYGVDRPEGSPFLPYTTTCETLTENDIQKAIDAVEARSGNKVNFIICSWGVRRALFDVLSKYRHTESVVLEGGFNAITFNGIPIVADRFCPQGTMYLLNTDDFELHQLCDWQWLESEEGKILKQTAGKPVFTATLVKYAELLCSNPGGQAMISGITES